MSATHCTLTTSATLTASECAVDADATSGDITFTLPEPAGGYIHVRKSDASTNRVFLVAPAGSIITGRTTLYRRGDRVSFIGLQKAKQWKAFAMQPAPEWEPLAPPGAGGAETDTAALAALAAHEALTGEAHGLAIKANIASPALTGTPTAPTAAAATNTTQVATTAFVKTAVDNLIAGAPGALDTLNEIAAQLATDESAVSALTTVVSGKVPATRNVNGYPLTSDVSLTKSDVGLSSVDNTADTDKPVSSAQQTALDLKLNASDGSVTNARTPTAHASSHQPGGSDPVKLDDLAAPDDNTDLNATTSAHGLLPKLPGGTAAFLRADGVFAAPAASLSLTTVEKDLGPLPRKGGTFDITGLSGLTPGNAVLIQQAAGPYTGKGTLADEANADAILVTAYVLDSSTIRAFWNCLTGFFAGNCKFNYLASS